LTIQRGSSRLVEVTRDGVVESVHHGHLVIAAARGGVLAAAGDPYVEFYPRSAVKPIQAMAALDLLADAGVELDAAATAIACASHTGSDDQQVEVARLLAMGAMDESALRCPEALPVDLPALRSQQHPTRLAHNCSGKHAALLLAQQAAGRHRGRYLRRDSPVQRQVRDRLARLTGEAPLGPGVDGCGAPAWRISLLGLAVAFARLATGGDERLAAVRSAMTTRPDLVGGPGRADTELMLTDGRVVAKSGAEGVLAVGIAAPAGPVGVAVKIADGAARAIAPAVAPGLRAVGVPVPAALAAPPVLGGRVPRGRISAPTAVQETLQRALAAGRRA
jgi:L-asparaginase II